MTKIRLIESISGIQDDVKKGLIKSQGLNKDLTEAILGGESDIKELFKIFLVSKEKSGDVI